MLFLVEFTCMYAVWFQKCQNFQLKISKSEIEGELKIQAKYMLYMQCTICTYKIRVFCL